MKKMFLFAALVVSMMFSCTDNERARRFGGKQTIELKKNEVLINCTWKEVSLWILTKDTITQKYHFREHSPYGLVEGEIIFK